MRFGMRQGAPAFFFGTLFHFCNSIPWCARVSAALQRFLTRLSCSIKDGSRYANSYCGR